MATRKESYLALLLELLLLFSSTRSTCLDDNDNPVYCNPPVQEDVASGVVPIVTSVCGSEGPEQICSIGNIHSCESCHSPESNPSSFITDGDSDTHWQSQTYNSIKDGVNVTLRLGKTHYIQKISIIFRGPRPDSFAILVSNDDSSSYTPLQYYSQSCQETYGISQDGIDSDGIKCIAEGSGLLPRTGGIATYTRPIEAGIVVAQDIQIRLDKLSTLGNELTWSNNSLNSYSYAISSLVVEGGCFCNGHADSCNIDQQSGVLSCSCQHNTSGVDCEMCLPSHNDIPWQPALEQHEETFSCRACNCRERSDECIFDSQTYLSSGKKTGGMCINCLNNTDGNQCDKCAEGFFPNNNNNNDEDLNCTACVCDPRGVTGGDGSCETAATLFITNGSSCPCKPNVDGVSCNTCKLGYYNLLSDNSDGCQVCQCNNEGSLSTVCNEMTGQCICKLNHYGRTCQSCDCHINGTVAQSLCNEDNGQCRCIEGVSGVKCDTCISGYYDIAAGCRACNCNENGSINSSCDVVTGQCQCVQGYSGLDCSMCPDGYHDISNGCTACPDCYESVFNDYNTTERLLINLIHQTNLTLSSSELDNDLIDRVNNSRTSLTELLESLRNLSRREVFLEMAVNETNTSVENKETQLSNYSNIVRSALIISINSFNKANDTRFQVDALFQLLALYHSELLEITNNLTNAYTLLEDVLELRQELIDIANQSDVTSREQEQIVTVLQRTSDIILYNTTESLNDVCEAVENENSTVVHLRGVVNCTIPELDRLLINAQMQLQEAISSSARVLNESIVLYGRVLNTVIPNFDGLQLLNKSEVLLNGAEQYEDDINAQTNETRILQDLFNDINVTVTDLSIRVTILNSTAVDLIERARVALSLANSSTVSAEEVISETTWLLEELNIRLNELMDFLERYENLLEVVERAENVSERAVNESDRQYTELQRISVITDNIDRILVTTVNNLDNAIMITEAANMTAFSALGKVNAVTATLENLPDQFTMANESLAALSERATDDRKTIIAAESSTNATATRAYSLEVDVLRIEELLLQLETEINNVTHVAESRYNSLINNINSLEVMITQMEQNIAVVSDEVSTLQDQSEVLEMKYTEIRRHVDLLNDILLNIQNLDCDSQLQQ